MKVKTLLCALTTAFEQAGIEDARTDARQLVAFALKKPPVFVRMQPDFEVEPDDLNTIEGFKQRRLKREPVSKITGTRGFWRLDFKVTPDVLDPRPDSETLIEEILRLKPEKAAAFKILDLGTGSGCLALSLLSEYLNASATGLDQSEAALAVARENAALNGLSERFKTVAADWTVAGWEKKIAAPFDIIIANPPYIAADEKLEPEVALYDPAKALFAGADGLEAYRILAPAVENLLAAGGTAVFEVGKGRHDQVRTLMEQAGLRFSGFGVDLGGIVRSVAVITLKL